MKLDEIIKNALIESLNKHHGNRMRVAEDLGKSYSWVRTWVENFGLDTRFKAYDHREKKPSSNGRLE
jgi:hypothetical protein